MTIADNLNKIYRDVAGFESQHQRSKSSVNILAVTKTKPIDNIVAAYESGQRTFGENYVQEAVDKADALLHLDDIEWHFIGPIQSNKSRLVAEKMDWVHSVDRVKIALRLNEQRPKDLPKLNVCIQVNISGEESKSGVLLQDVNEVADIILQQPQLCLRGLMAIPAPQKSIDAQIQVYKPLQQAYLALQSKITTIDTLSIGMSNDMDAAIACGSTMVRIGTAIFGSRNYA